MVDGKWVEPVRAAEHMLAIPIGEGRHEVKLFYVPKGMLEGMAVTGVTMLMLVAVKKMFEKKNC